MPDVGRIGPDCVAGAEDRRIKSIKRPKSDGIDLGLEIRGDLSGNRIGPRSLRITLIVKVNRLQDEAGFRRQQVDERCGATGCVMPAPAFLGDPGTRGEN